MAQSLDDHTVKNLYTPVQLDRRKPTKSYDANLRRDLIKGNEDLLSESRVPLMMTSSSPSPIHAPPHTHTYTNEEDSRRPEDVTLQDFPPSPTKYGPPALHTKGKKHAYHNKAVHLSENGRQPAHNGPSANDFDQQNKKQSMGKSYAVPTSVFDRTNSTGEYVEEEDIMEEEESGEEVRNGYLTPSEFLPSSTPLDHDKVLIGRPISQPEDDPAGHRYYVHERGVRSIRFDSGVSDCGNSLASTSPSMSSAGSLSNPRLSVQMEQHYEDIEEYCREYKNRKTSKESDVSNLKEKKVPSKKIFIHPHPHVNIGGVTQSDSDDIHEPEVCVSTAQTSSPQPPERIRQDGTLPHTYSRLNMQNGGSPLKTKESRICGGCLLMCFLFFIFIVSMASLGVSVYVLLSRDDSDTNTTIIHNEKSSPFNESHSVNVLSIELQEMKTKLEELQMQNMALRNSLKEYQNRSLSSVQSLTDKVNMLAFDQGNASVTLQAVATSLRSEIANISLTPGPQGPQGVGNFSLCQIKSTSIALPASDTVSTDTEFAPALDSHEDQFTIFAFCTYSGATQAKLEYKRASSKIQYRCSCIGLVNGISRTTCTLNCLVCPRLTLHSP